MKLISPAYQILEEQRISARNAEVNKQNNSPAISKRQKRINRSKSSHSLLMKMIAVGRYLQKKKLVKSCTDSKIEIARQAAIDLNLSLPDILSKKRAEPIIEQAYSILKNSNRLPEKPVKKHKKHDSSYKPYKQYQQERLAFYESREWRELRYQALKLHARKCMVCGASSTTGAVLHVDHIKPRSKYPELELEINNLQVLCADCNLGKSNKDEIDWRSQ